MSIQLCKCLDRVVDMIIIQSKQAGKIVPGDGGLIIMECAFITKEEEEDTESELIDLKPEFQVMKKRIWCVFSREGGEKECFSADETDSLCISILSVDINELNTMTYDNNVGWILSITLQCTDIGNLSDREYEISVHYSKNKCEGRARLKKTDYQAFITAKSTCDGPSSF